VLNFGGIVPQNRDSSNELTALVSSSGQETLQ
jgi:hypothetical protein